MKVKATYYPNYIAHYGVSIHDGAPGVGTGNGRNSYGVPLKYANRVAWSDLKDNIKVHEKDLWKEIIKSDVRKKYIEYINGIKNRNDMFRKFSKSVYAKNHAFASIKKRISNPDHNQIDHERTMTQFQALSKYLKENPNSKEKKILDRVQKATIDYDAEMEKVARNLINSGKVSLNKNINKQEVVDYVKSMIDDDSQVWYRFYENGLASLKQRM